MDKKVCSICNTEKQLSEYYTQNKIKADGTEYIYCPPYCKECTIKKSSKWQIENIERKRELTKKYMATDKAKIQRKNKWSRNYRTSGKRKEWEINNTDKIREYNFQRESNKKHTITNEEWESCKNYFNYRCAYCSLAIENHYIKINDKIILGDFHKEHVDHIGANDLSNCVPSCRSCNSSKHDFELEEWYRENNQMCESFSYERFLKIIKWLTEDYIKYINSKEES